VGVICLVIGDRRTPERVFTKNLSLTFGSGRCHVDDAIEKSMVGSPTFIKPQEILMEPGKVVEMGRASEETQGGTALGESGGHNS
jgi:hypothetical protein